MGKIVGSLKRVSLVTCYDPSSSKLHNFSIWLAAFRFGFCFVGLLKDFVKHFYFSESSIYCSFCLQIKWLIRGAYSSIQK